MLIYSHQRGLNRIRNKNPLATLIRGKGGAKDI